jgi:hypothetical protein
MDEKGWLKRALDQAAENVNALPEWVFDGGMKAMRRASIVEGKGYGMIESDGGISLSETSDDTEDTSP